MTRIALISDVHSNVAALEAVLRDIERTGAEELLCLGDVVGYGPDVVECVDLVAEHASLTVQGNHDEALVHGGYGFHLRAREALDWSRDQLKPGFFSSLRVRQRWEWITSLPLRHERGRDVFVHGSPRDPTTEYLLAHRLHHDLEAFEEAFAATERALFVGHTHLPCAITDRYEVFTPDRVDGRYRLGLRGEARVILNVGSVGQPRDEDPRACYALVDEEGDELVVSWRRIPYDVERTILSVGAIERLHPSLGERLRVGK